MSATRMRLIVGLVVAVLGTATACTDDGKSGTAAGGKAQPPGVTSPSVRYEGPDLPGLAKEPAWSLSGDHTGWKIHALGDVVVLIHSADTGSASSSVIEFRDVRSGAVRKSVDTPVREAWVGTYNGKPALYMYFQKVTPSDGLSPEKRVDVREVYDGTGAKMMSVAKPAGEETFALVDSWVVSSRQGDPALTISDAQGRQRHRIGCGGELLCVLETPYVVQGGMRLPAVVGNFAFQAQPIVGSSGTGALRIIATNLDTGQQVWTTSTIDKPAGTAAEGKVSGPHAMPIRMINGKLLLAWYTEHSDGFGERGEILALHDPASGKLLVTGPELGNGYKTMVVDAKGEIAVVGDAAHDAHSLAWELNTGKTLWRQEKNERSMIPDLIAGDVLYGLVRADTARFHEQPIAVDLNTKAIRKEKLEGTAIPVAAGNGYVAMINSHGLFVFPTVP